jgi:hypothetical protein
MKMLITALFLASATGALADPISFSGQPAKDAYDALTGSAVIVDAGLGHAFKTGTDIACQAPNDPRLKNRLSLYSCRIDFDADGKIAPAQ